jgi:hypothetical protein
MKRSLRTFWAVLILAISCLAVSVPENKTIISAMVIIMALNIIHSAIFTPEEGFGSIPDLIRFEEYQTLASFKDPEAYVLVVSLVEDEELTDSEEEKMISTCIVRVHKNGHEMPVRGSRFTVDALGNLIFEKPNGQSTKMTPM